MRKKRRSDVQDEYMKKEDERKMKRKERGEVRTVYGRERKRMAEKKNT